MRVMKIGLLEGQKRRLSVNPSSIRDALRHESSGRLLHAPFLI